MDFSFHNVVLNFAWLMFCIVSFFADNFFVIFSKIWKLLNLEHVK